jgi:hypothetical protein
LRSRAVFAPLLAALAIVTVGAGFAIVAGATGLGFLPRLNDAHPRFGALPPLATRSGPPLTQRVVLVIIDGLSQRHAYQLPFLDRLRSGGIDAVARSHPPTISRPNYVSIVTGVPPELSGVRTNDAAHRVDLDSLMDRLAARGRATAYVSDSSDGLPYLFFEDLEDSTYAPWPDGFAKATRLALARDYPLVILLPGAIDDAGHLKGARSPAYRDAAVFVDRQLAAALGGLDLEHDTLIAVADHGHTERGGHGGLEPEVVEVPLILAGAGIRAGALVRDAELIDLAPTIAALLGVAAPGHGVGRTLTEALALDPARAASLREQDGSRIARNREAFAAIAEEASQRIEAARASRLSLTVSGVAIALVLLIMGARFGAFYIDWRVLLIAVPAFPLAFYALLDMAGQHFSLSALPDEGAGARRVFAFGGGAVAVQVFANWLALRGRVVLRDRLAAANAVAICGLLVAGIPAALAWAIFGPGPFVQLPQARWLFLIPAMYIAVACFAVAAAASLSLELIVFLARAADPRLPLRRAQRRVARERSRLRARIETVSAPRVRADDAPAASAAPNPEPQPGPGPDAPR